MNFAICDDDILFCNQFQKYLKEYFSSNHSKSPQLYIFHSGEDLLASDISFDIVFLDVEMSGVSGIHTGRALKERNPKIIFMIITSYNDYLDEALRFQAFRYLSKPLDKERLFRNLKDALYVYNTYSKKVAIETKTETLAVFTSDIIMVEATGRKVYVRTTTDDYLSIRNMQYWAEHLGSTHFFQSHRSYIINFEHVSRFDNNLIYLFQNRYTAYLTYRKHTAFKNAYLLYLESTT